MKIKGQIINANSISVDKDSKIDELKITLNENSNLSIIQGKRAKETIVSVEDSKVYINSKSKAFWKTDEVKVKDAEGNSVKVEKDDNGFSFIAVVGATYVISVAHKLRALLLLLLAFLAIVLITIPLLFSNKPIEPVQEQTPIGNYEVGGKRENPIVEEVEEDVPTITFSGYGKFTVSKERTDVEFSNPANNFVNMQFTLIDDLTGDVVARTGLVAPDNYVYVNVMDYYKDKKGEFNTTIQIDTFTDDGQQMNGMTEKMILIVE